MVNICCGPTLFSHPFLGINKITPQTARSLKGIIARWYFAHLILSMYSRTAMIQNIFGFCPKFAKIGSIFVSLGILGEYGKFFKCFLHLNTVLCAVSPNKFKKFLLIRRRFCVQQTTLTSSYYLFMYA